MCATEEIALLLCAGLILYINVLTAWAAIRIAGHVTVDYFLPLLVLNVTSISIMALAVYYSANTP